MPENINITIDDIKDRASLLSRAGLQFGGKRDIYKVFGYPRDIKFDDYLAYYLRQDLSKAIIAKPPADTWKQAPLIFTKGEDANSKLTAEIDSIAGRTKLWSVLERADRIAGIGDFGILLIGYADGKDLNEPVASMSGGADKLLYLKPYWQGSIKSMTFVKDTKDKRFGLPEVYFIKMSGSESSKTGLENVEVHWSRIIHIAEDLNQNDVFGTPRLQAVFNRMLDMDKISGGSAEGFWEMATRWVLFDLQADADIKMTSEDKEEMKDQLELLRLGYEKYLRTQGVDVKTIDPVEIQPEQAFQVILSLISAGTGIPKRILIGSERGELASSQDQANWFSLIETRRNKFAEPVILRPLIDSLMANKVLTPTEYEVTWPNLFELTALEESEMAKNYGAAVASISPDPIADGVITADEVRQRITPGLELAEIDITPEDREIVRREVNEEGAGAGEWSKLYGDLKVAGRWKNRVIARIKKIVRS